MNHLEPADTFDVDRTSDQLDVADSDGAVLPGGVANPDQLRMDEASVAFVRAMVDAGKPLAAICHGPWTLVEADVVRDRTLTSWPRSAQTPNTLITSRKPDDLPAFCRTLIEEFSERWGAVAQRKRSRAIRNQSQLLAIDG